MAIGALYVSTHHFTDITSRIFKQAKTTHESVYITTEGNCNGKGYSDRPMPYSSLGPEQSKNRWHKFTYRS